MLTLTPQIIRFPDIKEEDLAPIWVGTESRISYFGASPRVQSGRASRGPFDDDRNKPEGRRTIQANGRLRTAPRRRGGRRRRGG